MTARGRLRTIVATAAVTTIACGAAGAPASAAAKGTRCGDPSYASGELVVRGVSCTAADAVIDAALAHPPCRPKKADAQLGRGCNGTVRVKRWRCKGLFPGEGFSLTCTRGAKRRIDASAGG